MVVNVILIHFAVQATLLIQFAGFMTLFHFCYPYNKLNSLASKLWFSNYLKVHIHSFSILEEHASKQIVFPQSVFAFSVLNCPFHYFLNAHCFSACHYQQSYNSR